VGVATPSVHGSLLDFFRSMRLGIAERTFQPAAALASANLVSVDHELFVVERPRLRVDARRSAG
jgi:hypothetical protein